MCQDENEKPKLWIFLDLCMTNEPILQCIIVLRAWFVCHRLYPERTKTFIFGFVFVFVLAHEQPISMCEATTWKHHYIVVISLACATGEQC